MVFSPETTRLNENIKKMNAITMTTYRSSSIKKFSAKNKSKKDTIQSDKNESGFQGRYFELSFTGPVQLLLWFGVLFFVNRRNRRFCIKVRGVNLGW
jgi:hypothetical protein